MNAALTAVNPNRLSQHGTMTTEGVMSNGNQGTRTVTVCDMASHSARGECCLKSACLLSRACE
jgi:hypothetical protein